MQRNRWAQCPLESPPRPEPRHIADLAAGPLVRRRLPPSVPPANQPAFPRERPQELEQATRIQRRPRSIDGEQG
ncbi:hypothetical protein G5714_000084 [Onychostoma macrolepis]|uniref:Uncharacterized protein n=1 Tax=Onychostoma macrolepis TaxID=369639 RepID=A0A7J6DFC4_9TELE|nr:hypothetical protein G5714_000084 [Onychostoma macrolepis]